MSLLLSQFATNFNQIIMRHLTLNSLTTGNGFSAGIQISTKISFLSHCSSRLSVTTFPLLKFNFSSEILFFSNFGLYLILCLKTFMCWRWLYVRWQRGGAVHWCCHCRRCSWWRWWRNWSALLLEIRAQCWRWWCWTCITMSRVGRVLSWNILPIVSLLALPVTCNVFNINISGPN